MKFDFVIGNPPYQDETLGDNKGFAPPVYHKFLEEAYKIANTVEMIHPARFLFNAGSTPKQWNDKIRISKYYILSRTVVRYLVIRILKAELSLRIMIMQKIMVQSELLQLMMN